MNTTMIGLYAETSIHAGAGSSTGVIDLPIMRESHTGYPCIFGSAMKGAFRAYAETKITDTNKIKNIFGTEANEKTAWAGALMMGDAKLLLLPVRSLTTHFRWVTCPAILKRLQNDIKRLNINIAFQVPKIDTDDQCLTSNGNEKNLYLEEYNYQVNQIQNTKELTDALSQFMPVTSDNIAKQLTIVSDNQFSHLSQMATAITPHIAIENETKTVKSGALWYEETLPSETIMYTFMSTENTRNKDGEYSAEKIQQDLKDIFKTHPYLQVGGNETVGMGWMHLNFINSQTGENNG